MANIYTTAGLNLIARLQAEGNTLTIDKMIYADVTGLDPETTPPVSEVVPTADVVYEDSNIVEGFSGNNSVLYSSRLGSDVGDFYFNWIGLYCSEHNTLVQVAYVPRQQKRAGTASSLGNMMSRTFALVFTNARETANATIEAEFWQIDFEAWLRDGDDRLRQANLDVYGDNFFKGNAFLLQVASFQPGNFNAILRPGTGYVKGIRVEMAETAFVCDYNKHVFIDVRLEESADGCDVAYQIRYEADDTLTDYVDGAGQQHYVLKIAESKGYGVIPEDFRKTEANIAGADNLAGEVYQNKDDIAVLINDTLPTLTKNSDFKSSKSTNGFFEFPGGFIIQWGQAITGNEVTFPKAFPTACVNVHVTQRDHYDTMYTNEIYANEVTTTKFRPRHSHSGTEKNRQIWWMAIGF